jgi:cytochrome c553
MSQMRTAFVLALGLGLGVSSWISAQTPVPDAAPAASAPEKTPAKTVCLACHSYDEVIAKTADHMMPGGDKISPHRYVDFRAGKDPALKPHRVTGVENIPECSNCHKGQPVPHTGPVDRSALKVDFCYTSCHHQENFSPCSECH